MNAKLIVYLVLVVLLGGLVYFSYSQTSKLSLANEKNKNLTTELESAIASKQKSEKAVADLARATNALQSATNQSVAKITHVPVDKNESCMSPVLKSALSE